jgi:predicted helicase
MDLWLPPPEWGVSAHAHHLKNLYVYFWRWSTLKVFGSGWRDATGESNEDRHGIVCFITAAGFLNGPGFQKMRQELRRDCSEIWVIDCSPEGHQPDVPTRIFQGVQHQVCIVLAARSANKTRDVPGRLRYLALPAGKREEKFRALAKLSLAGADWENGATDWRDPFLPERAGVWGTFPPLADFFVDSNSGVKTHRTWVISPDSKSLERRWDTLRKEKDAAKKEDFFHPDRDRYLTKEVTVHLGLHELRSVTVAKDQGPIVLPCRYSFRSLDRQWIVPDHRLLSMARPQLWAQLSDRQVFATALEAMSPTGGPALIVTSLVPDQDHYNGRGGRVYSLWRNSAATQPNIRPALLTHLAIVYGHPAKAEDVMAYLAAVMAHPAYTARFKGDLVRPGLRVPLTADAKLFAEAVALGSEVIWLHCYGERFADASAGRPKQAPRLSKERAPYIPSAGAIPPQSLPDTMDYDPGKASADDW